MWAPFHRPGSLLVDLPKRPDDFYESKCWRNMYSAGWCSQWNPMEPLHLTFCDHGWPSQIGEELQHLATITGRSLAVLGWYTRSIRLVVRCCYHKKTHIIRQDLRETAPYDDSMRMHEGISLLLFFVVQLVHLLLAGFLDVAQQFAVDDRHGTSNRERLNGGWYFA